ncbi:MAG: Cobyrinic acid ac-diamide synthase [Frankiales bacterium]|jgi:chromosome partitioning protein|nr:Cobyrinic acid ac-diamide synthase [Frankiales bacterium]
MTDLGWPHTTPDSAGPLGWPGRDKPGPVPGPVPVPEPSLPDYRPVDLATDPLPPAPSEPVDRIRQALRDESADTPIGQAAAAAVRVMNPSGSHDFPKPARRRILTVANQKGGVGKTTSTVNLAAALALHGATVLVIDLDPQGNASTGLGAPHSSGTPSIYEVLLDNVPIADVVQTSPDIPSLRTVPATIDLAGAEIELVSVVARESRLQRAIAAYVDGPGSDVDFVLVDCPPSLGLLTLNAMVATEEVLIPIQCEYYALEGLGQLLKTIELVKANLNPRLAVSTILLTMYDARTRLADQVAAEVRSHFGDTVLTTMIPRSVRVSEAPGYGQSVVTYDPGSRGSVAYLEAAREIAVRGASI